MVVLNGMSRYHLAMEALRRTVRTFPRATALIDECNTALQKAVAYSKANLEDAPEISNWHWPG
jgi:xylulose-5-phosphate/fructose-6-phosphate phosphoketolase